MSKTLYSRKDTVQNTKVRTFDTEILKKDLERYNPTLKSILKVERLFKENIEFDSKTQLLRKLDGSMKAPVLNVILRYLAKSNKILLDKDGSIVWIDATDNKKLKTSYNKAIKL